MLNAIIIDDMPDAIASLKADLAAYCPEIKLIGEADGVVSGAKLLRHQQPDLLFLDIQLQDGTGFDILEILPKIPFKVIFTTASDAFAVKAFRFAAIDYLLKPIDPDNLIEAVAKAKQSINQQGEQLELLAEHMKQGQETKRIALHTQEKIQVVSLDDIIRCEAVGNYTNFFFTSGKKLLVTKTMKEFEKMLEDFNFLRVHQSHLVNIQHIEAFVKTEGGYLAMKDNSHVSVSVRKRTMVLKLLGDL
jgi:two-component system LytT family response regulator